MQQGLDNGELHTKHLVSRATGRRLPFILWAVSVGFGSVCRDTDHFLNLVTKGKVAWAFLHAPYVDWILFGCIVASVLGLYTMLVLRRKLW